MMRGSGFPGVPGPGSSSAPLRSGSQGDSLGQYHLVPGSNNPVSESPKGEPGRRSSYDQNLPSWRRSGKEIISSSKFQGLMALIIVGNALVIGFETDLPDLPCWNPIENLFLLVFSMELVLKMVVLGPKGYFDVYSEDFQWNTFDFFIVSLGAFDFIMTLIPGNTKGSGGVATVFRIIRLLRILRIFRIVRFLKQLLVLASGLASAATAMFWVSFMMLFMLYVCSIILVRTVGREQGSYSDFLGGQFGNIPTSMLTLFELMSQPNLLPYHELIPSHPLLALFLIAFIIFGSFGMIALLTGVISESMHEKTNIRMEEERNDRETLQKKLMKKIAVIWKDLPHRNANGQASRSDIEKMLPRIQAMMDEAGAEYNPHDLEGGPDKIGLLDLMDHRRTGFISGEDFQRCILKIAEGDRPISLNYIQYDVAYLKDRVDMSVGFSKDSAHAGAELHKDVKMLSGTLEQVALTQKEMLRSYEDISFLKNFVIEHMKTVPGKIKEVQEAQKESQIEMKRQNEDMAATKKLILENLREMKEQLKVEIKEVKEVKGSINELRNSKSSPSVEVVDVNVNEFGTAIPGASDAEAAVRAVKKMANEVQGALKVLAVETSGLTHHVETLSEAKRRLEPWSSKSEVEPNPEAEVPSPSHSQGQGTPVDMLIGQVRDIATAQRRAEAQIVSCQNTLSSKLQECEDSLVIKIKENETLLSAKIKLSEAMLSSKLSTETKDLLKGEEFLIALKEQLYEYTKGTSRSHSDRDSGRLSPQPLVASPEPIAAWGPAAPINTTLPSATWGSPGSAGTSPTAMRQLGVGVPVSRAPSKAEPKKGVVGPPIAGNRIVGTPAPKAGPDTVTRRGTPPPA